MGITNLGNFNDIAGKDNSFTGNNTFSGTNTFTGTEEFTGTANFSNQINVPPAVYSDNAISMNFLQETANCKFAAQTITPDTTNYPDGSFTQVVFDALQYTSSGLQATYDSLTGTWTLASNRVYVINCQLFFQSNSTYGYTGAVAIGAYFDIGAGWVFPLGSLDGYSGAYSSTASSLLLPNLYAVYATGTQTNVKLGIFVEFASGITRLIGKSSSGTASNRLILQEYYQFT